MISDGSGGNYAKTWNDRCDFPSASVRLDSEKVRDTLRYFFLRKDQKFEFRKSHVLEKRIAQAAAIITYLSKTCDAVVIGEIGI